MGWNTGWVRKRQFRFSFRRSASRAPGATSRRYSELAAEGEPTARCSQRVVSFEERRAALPSPRPSLMFSDSARAAIRFALRAGSTVTVSKKASLVSVKPSRAAPPPHAAWR